MRRWKSETPRLNYQYLTIIGEYSPIITSHEANNCFSINTQVIIPKTKKKAL